MRRPSPPSPIKSHPAPSSGSLSGYCYYYYYYYGVRSTTASIIISTKYSILRTDPTTLIGTCWVSASALWYLYGVCTSLAFSPSPSLSLFVSFFLPFYYGPDLTRLSVASQSLCCATFTGVEVVVLLVCSSSNYIPPTLHPITSYLVGIPSPIPPKGGCAAQRRIFLFT